jgi:hypothetical protein
MIKCPNCKTELKKTSNPFVFYCPKDKKFVKLTEEKAPVSSTSFNLAFNI